MALGNYSYGSSELRSYEEKRDLFMDMLCPDHLKGPVQRREWKQLRAEAFDELVEAAFDLAKRDDRGRGGGW